MDKRYKNNLGGNNMSNIGKGTSLSADKVDKHKHYQQGFVGGK